MTEHRGMGGHHRPFDGNSHEWLTPPEIVEALGPFDLDPCCPPKMPWRTAEVQYTKADDGLSSEWWGSVWLNPPYGPNTGPWLAKLASHGSGIALIFARTETGSFFEWVWNRADAVFFLQGRLHFHHLSGDRARHNAGAPSVLVAYGEEYTRRLEQCKLGGQFIKLGNETQHKTG